MPPPNSQTSAPRPIDTPVCEGDLPCCDVELAGFWDTMATTDEERQESVAAVRAYVRGDLAEVDEYLKRRHRRWVERARQPDAEEQDGTTR